MPVFADQYPAQLPAQARTALFEWYSKTDAAPEIEAPYVATNADIPF